MVRDKISRTISIDFMPKNQKLLAQENLHQRIDKVVSMKERLEQEVVRHFFRKNNERPHTPQRC